MSDIISVLYTLVATLDDGRQIDDAAPAPLHIIEYAARYVTKFGFMDRDGNCLYPPHRIKVLRAVLFEQKKDAKPDMPNGMCDARGCFNPVDYRACGIYLCSVHARDIRDQNKWVMLVRRYP